MTQKIHMERVTPWGNSELCNLNWQPLKRTRIFKEVTCGRCLDRMKPGRFFSYLATESEKCREIVKLISL
jgi:hypothetical protein